MDEYAGIELLPISLFWRANYRALGKNHELANKIMVALVNTGMTLYFMNDDFYGVHPFVEFPLSNTCTEHLATFIAYSYECVSTEGSLNSATDDERPAWFSQTLRLKFKDEYEDQLYEIDKTGLRVNLETLFVRCFDVKHACQLQGLDIFYWARPYEKPESMEPYKYTLKRCLDKSCIRKNSEKTEK